MDLNNFTFFTGKIPAWVPLVFLGFGIAIITLEEMSPSQKGRVLQLFEEAFYQFPRIPNWDK